MTDDHQEPDDSDLPPAEDPANGPFDPNADDRTENLDQFLKELQANDQPPPSEPKPLAEPPEIGELLDAELGSLPDDFEVPPAEAIAPDAPQTPQEPLPVTFLAEEGSEPSDGPKAADTLLEHLERFGNFDENIGQSPESGGADFPDSDMGSLGGDTGGGGSGKKGGSESSIPEALDATYNHSEASTDYLVEHTRKINELTARLERERI